MTIIPAAASYNVVAIPLAISVIHVVRSKRIEVVGGGEVVGEACRYERVHQCRQHPRIRWKAVPHELTHYGTVAIEVRSGTDLKGTTDSRKVRHCTQGHANAPTYMHIV